MKIDGLRSPLSNSPLPVRRSLFPERFICLQHNVWPCQSQWKASTGTLVLLAAAAQSLALLLAQPLQAFLFLFKAAVICSFFFIIIIKAKLQHRLHIPIIILFCSFYDVSTFSPPFLCEVSNFFCCFIVSFTVSFTFIIKVQLQLTLQLFLVLSTFRP